MFAQCLQLKRTICDCSRLIYFSSLYFVLNITTQLFSRIGPISWPNMDMFWTDFFSPMGGKESNSYQNCDRAGLCCVFGEESFQKLPLQLWPSLIYDFLFQMTKSHLLVFKCSFWALVYVERVEVSLVSDGQVILKKLSTLLCFGLFFILDNYFKDLKPPTLFYSYRLLCRLL